MKKVIRATAKSLSKNFYRVIPPSAKKEFQDLMNGGDSPEPEPPVTSGYTFEGITLPDGGESIFYPEGYTAGQTIMVEDIQTYFDAVLELAKESLSSKDTEEMSAIVVGTLPVEESSIYATQDEVHLSASVRIPSDS